MKKILFSAASLVLLAASCTQDEFESISVQDVKGITFESSLKEAPQSRADMTWNEDAQKYDYFWWAEQDIINVYGTLVTSTNPSIGNGAKLFKSAKSAQYKATKSEARGQFTGINESNILKFSYLVTSSDNATAIENKTSRFLATYPKNVTMLVDETEANQVQLIGLPVLAAQENTKKGANQVSEKVAMYSYTTAYAEEGYESVGEKINLEFIRPFTALIFKTVGATDYKADFGNLASITVTAKGYDKDADGSIDASKGDIVASIIANNTPDEGENDTLTIDVKTKKVVSYEMNKPVSTVKLTVKRAWDDTDRAYAAINYVNRKAFSDKGVKEKMEIVYTFDRIEFKKEIETSANWPSEQGNNKFIDVPALDITSYDYLLTLPSVDGAKDRTLIINKGTFGAIFKSGTENEQILWAGVGVNVDEVSTIVSEVELTTDELALLKKFDNLKNITLKKNTSIPSKTFTSAQAGAITKIDMPLVTSIANDFHTSGSFGALATLNLGSYNFASPLVNSALFNASTKSTLKVLDMSGVDNMLPTFGIDRSLSFEEYALEEITIKNGMKVAPKGFKNCYYLHTVNGAVDLLNGEEAFAKAGTVGVDTNGDGEADKFLKTINVYSTIITAGAFNECDKLENVLYNGVQIVPTKVEDRALRLTGVKYMDLSNCSVIGEAAFSGSALTSPNKDTEIMIVAAEEIPYLAFYGTNLTMVNFTNATKIGNNILKETSLKHLKFTKAFTVDATTTVMWGDVFGANPETIDLFINPSQKYMSTKTKMSLPYKSGNTTKYVDFQFKTVQYE